MVLKVRSSVWDAVQNLGFENLGDYAISGQDVTTILIGLLAAGSAIYIPAGSWDITSISIPVNAVIFGAGDKSILRVKNSANAVNLVVGSGAILENFQIDGNKVNQLGVNLHTIQMVNAVRAKLRGIKVINSKADAFNITGAVSSDIELDNCSATGFLGNGLRVEQGSDIAIREFNAYTSDPVATGDGIAITSNGNLITRVSLINPISKGNSGRGIALLGNGSKNVTDVVVMNPRTVSNSSNGIHLINTTGTILLGGVSVSNGIDGVRLEGDVQYTRITNVIAKSNTSFGMREVIAGSTPNFNTFAYDISQLNGNNTITIVGANSLVVP